MILPSTLSLTASDPSGQRRTRLNEVNLDCSVGELLEELQPVLFPDRLGPDRQELVVEARLEREMRALSRAERVRDCLQAGDHLVLQPRIMAGGARSPHGGF